MSSAAQRKVTITYTGDVGGTQELTATENSPSPASIQVVTLTEADPLEVVVPANAVCMTILKPSDNVLGIFLAGAADETGLLLHPTQPDSITLAPDQTSVWLELESDDNAETNSSIDVRLYWT